MIMRTSGHNRHTLHFSLRIRALAGHYFRLLLIFILQKPLFMLYTGAISNGYPFRDWLRVIRHGIPIDLSVAAYLTVLPLMLCLVSVWTDSRLIKRIWQVYDVLMALLLALVFVADAALYPFWGYKLDASVFFYLRNPGEAFASVSFLFTLLGILAILILAHLYYRYTVAVIRPFDQPFIRLLMRGTVSTLLLLVTAPLLLAIRGGVKESTMNVGHAYFSEDQYLNHSAVNPAFSMFSSMGKSNDWASYYDFMDEDNRERLMRDLFSTNDYFTEELLRTDRPDILILVLEGFGGDMVHSLGGMEGVSPCLDSIAAHGVFFSRCYADSYRTDRGMVSLMNGHPALPVTSIMKIPVKSAALPSISGKLEENGYTNSFIYGGDINFTNMKSWLMSHGYSHITSDVDFTASERRGNAWGVNDEVTFSRLAGMLKNAEKHPWHTALLSLSSHEPFEVPFSRFEDPIPNSFAYTDSCVGRLVDELRSHPLWDNLLMVIIPDHGFRYPKEGFFQAPHVHRIPVIWTGGAVKGPKVVDCIMKQSDMAATLLGQLGIDHSDFLYSRNVLSSSYSYPFAYYTFNNGFCFMDDTGTTLYDAAADQCIPVEGSDDDASPASQLRLDRGKAILQTLYDDLASR